MKWACVQLTFTAGYGGGLTSAILLMRPDLVPLNFFTDYTDLVFTICWWLVNYFPYNLPGKVVRTKFVTEITKLLLLVAVGKVMTNRIDTTLRMHPQATVAALMIGAHVCLPVTACTATRDMSTASVVTREYAQALWEDVEAKSSTTSSGGGTTLRRSRMRCGCPASAPTAQFSAAPSTTYWFMCTMC